MLEQDLAFIQDGGHGLERPWYAGMGKRSEQIGQEHESQAKIEERSSIGFRALSNLFVAIPCVD
ncbi:hypothetical protein PO002_34315 [Cupriavidus necator]|uniref:hypothetical protein n=1 Tax=Cupriavidus necator TaxID=106590 RepID=UPI0039C4B2E8